VDAILGPYSSPITEAVADVTEKHKMPMVAPIAGTTSIFKKGRKFIFMVYPASGRDAEFLYGTLIWDAQLVTLRAGGLIPIARQYPGAREFAESYKKEFPGADLFPLPRPPLMRAARSFWRPSSAPAPWRARR
jgi:hypothetical protein